MLGHHRHASETPFKWRFADRPMYAHVWWYLDPLSKKNIVKVGHPLTDVLDPRMKTKHSFIIQFGSH